MANDSYKDKRIDTLLEVFHTYDTDHSGSIEPSELATVLQALDPVAWTSAKVDSLMRVLDKNGDGMIEVDEFIAWAFESFEGDDLRDHLGLEKPKVIWKNFDVEIKMMGKRAILKEVHPSHLAANLLERVAIEMNLAPSEVVLTVKDDPSKQIKVMRPDTDFPKRCACLNIEMEEKHLSDEDYGFVKYCVPGAPTPTLEVSIESTNKADIIKLGKERADYDETLRNMWFSEAIKGYKFRPAQTNEPGAECMCQLVHKLPPPKKAGEVAAPIGNYPILVFFVGDMENPASLYGKYVFPLTGEFPATKKGVPREWSEKVTYTGALDTKELKAQVDEERGHAKARAEEMSIKAEEEKNMDMRTEAENLREASGKPIPLKKLSAYEKEMIQDVVSPFVMRVWKKLRECQEVVMTFQPGQHGFDHDAEKIIKVHSEDNAKLKVGWKILKVDGRPVKSFNDTRCKNAMSGDKSYQVTFEQDVESVKETLQSSDRDGEGFEIMEARDLETGDEGERFANTVDICPIDAKLKIFKALHLLDIDATE